MKKLLFSLVVFLGLGLVGKAEAAGPVKGAKAVANFNYTTTVSTISAPGAAVIYQVILSSGTAGTDYVSIYDVASAASVAGATVASNLKARVVVSSATQNTVVTFDPPLQFNNGAIIANSVGTMWSAVTYEKGRVVQGY